MMNILASGSGRQQRGNQLTVNWDQNPGEITEITRQKFGIWWIVCRIWGGYPFVIWHKRSRDTGQPTCFRLIGSTDEVFDVNWKHTNHDDLRSCTDYKLHANDCREPQSPRNKRQRGVKARKLRSKEWKAKVRFSMWKKLSFNEDY